MLSSIGGYGKTSQMNNNAGARPIGGGQIKSGGLRGATAGRSMGQIGGSVKPDYRGSGPTRSLRPFQLGYR